MALIVVQDSQNIESLYDFVYLDRERLAYLSAQMSALCVKHRRAGVVLYFPMIARAGLLAFWANEMMRCRLR